MEEITNLISAANTAISNLEKFIFENKQEKYINIKAITEYMASQIEAAEIAVDIKNEEGYEAVKTSLNTIIAQCSELMKIFESQDNIRVGINESGEIITQEVNYESAPAPTEMEAPEIENSIATDIPNVGEANEDFVQPMEAETSSTPDTINAALEVEIKDDTSTTVENNQDLVQSAFAGTPEIEIIDGPSEVVKNQQVNGPEIQDAPEAIGQSAATQVPEISIIDDMPTTMEFGTKTPEVAPTDIPDYSKDLDVAAMDAFLSSPEPEQANTLVL